MKKTTKRTNKTATKPTAKTATKPTTKKTKTTKKVATKKPAAKNTVAKKSSTKKPRQVKASGATTSVDGVVVVHPTEESVPTAIEKPVFATPAKSKNKSLN